MSKIGIDISDWQRNVDYNKVLEKIGFAILRVGYGISYLPNEQRDAELDNHYWGFKGKIPLGAYYYAYGVDYETGRKEAENCLAYIGDKQFEMPIYYDMEEGRNTKEAGQGFVDRIREAGLKAGIYASSSFYADKGLYEINCDSIWIAEYDQNNGEIPPEIPTTPCNIWQYTSVGWVDGIDGNVDMNIILNDVPNSTGKSINELAHEVISGLWGNDEDRKNRLTDAGYNYDAVQNRVNELLSKKSNEEIANEVINGLWGNDEDRKNRLINAGYDYDAIQNIVNNILEPQQEYYTIQSGDTLSDIADKFGATIDQLCNWNDIDNPDVIYAGDTIRVK